MFPSPRARSRLQVEGPPIHNAIDEQIANPPLSAQHDPACLLPIHALPLFPPLPPSVFHPLPSEIVEFPLGVPSELLVTDDALDDVARVVTSFSGEGGGLQVSRRGDERSDLKDAKRAG
jgi:hypothetical protein